jgi:AraC-like DNA-binding protein
VEYHAKYAGRTFLRTSSKPVRREKQTVFLYAPGCIRREVTRDADFPIQETYLYLAARRNCILERLVSEKFRFARFTDPENIVGSIFSEAASTCSEKGDDSFWLLQGYLMRIFHHLLHASHLEDFDYLVSASHPGNTETEFSREVQEYLRKNIGRNVTLSEIASYMKASESLVSHRFKEETGVSPLSRHAELRIEFAKSLVLKGERLKSIAEMTGYSDEFHLSKIFKSVSGLSPRDFKKSVGAG